MVILQKTINKQAMRIISISIIIILSNIAVMAQDKEQQAVKQTAGRDQLGGFAPKFAELNDDVLFGEVWKDEECSPADTGEGSGIAGGDGPAAGGSMSGRSRAAFEREMLFPIGAPNDAYAQYFTGNSYLSVLSSGSLTVCNVTFEPGCRNNWHIHRASEGGGQILLCIAGRGWYQEWGKPAVALEPGDTVTIPANVKHWHGAAADSWFAHIAIEVPGKNQSNEWLEPVDDRHYGQLE